MNSAADTTRLVQLVNTIATKDGGPARHAVEINRALNVGNGLEVEMFVMAATNGSEMDNSGRGSGPASLNIHPASSSRIGACTPGNLLNALRAIAPADGVIIHGYYLWWVPVAIVYARLVGTTVFLMPHGSLNDYEQTRSALKKRIWSWSVGFCTDPLVNTFLVATQHEADQVRSSRRRRCTPVGAGSSIREQIRLPAGPRDPARMLVLSRIAPKKRIDRSIETLAEVRRRGVRAELTVAGGGDPDLLESLRSLARAVGVEQHVRFLGPVMPTQVASLYGSHDLYLAPSDDENFGIAVADAMCAGLPTVASAAVDCAVLVRADGIRVVPDPDGPSLANEVVSILTSPDFAELAAGVGEAARAEFDWDKVASRWRAAIRGGIAAGVESRTRA